MNAPYAAALAHLSAAEPALDVLIRRIGPCTFKPTPREPYEALVRAIAHQQLHGRAAEAILGRLVALHDGAFPDPHAVDALDDAVLRTCGFSGRKVRAIRDICARTRDGLVPSAAEAATLPDDELIARLVAIRGVGRWTVEMMLISTLGRPDVLPVDDFGVREGWRLINGLEVQPRPRELAVIGQAWSPWRSTAAWYLWRASDEGKKVPLPPPGGEGAPKGWVGG